jgi:alpha-galactosidase
MMNKLKVAFIGAGSRSFVGRTLVDLLLSEPLRAFDLELVLMDVIAEHITRTEAFCRRAAAQLGHPVTIRTTTVLDEAVAGADFVVTAFEVNRNFYWAQDFHVPRLYGSEQVYGENGGPGGIFHALRNMGPILQVAAAMERLCPNAWLINFSNPESKLCEALDRLTKIKAVGLCHGVFMGREKIARLLEMPEDDLQTAACGFNHFTWFQEIRHRQTGEDLYPLLRQKEAQADPLAEWDDWAMGRILFRTFGLWPSPGANHYGEYIRWAGDFLASAALQYYYDPAQGHPWETGQVPAFVYSLESNPTQRPLFPAKTAPTKADVADDGPLTLTPSNELMTPIIEGIACGLRHELPAIVYPNRGAIPNIQPSMTVEMPATVDKAGIHPHQMAPLPEGIAAMIRVQGSIQQLIVEAYAERSRNKLLQAILLDPTVKSYRGAVAMMNELLRLQQDLLPAFQ